MSCHTPEPTPSLTTAQRRFLEEYIAADENATRAYLKAFPDHSYGTARSESSKLLANPNIQAELQAMRDSYARALRVSKLKVMREIAAIAFADIGEAFEAVAGEPDKLLPISRMSPTVRKAIQHVKVRRRRVKAKGGGEELEEIEEVEYKFHNKLDALEKLCKRLGLFRESEGEEGQPQLTHAEQVQLIQKIFDQAKDQPHALDQKTG